MIEKIEKNMDFLRFTDSQLDRLLNMQLIRSGKIPSSSTLNGTRLEKSHFEEI